MRVLGSPASSCVALLVITPLLLAVMGPTAAQEDAWPGAEFDHQNGWWAARIVAPEDGFLAEIEVVDFWEGSQNRGAAFMAVLDDSGAEVGRFTLVGEDGAFTASVSAAGATIVPELPQVFETPFTTVTWYLLHLPLSGVHTLVFVGGAENGFTGGFEAFLPPDAIIAEASGTDAHFLTEADLECAAGVNAAVPRQQADGNYMAIAALAGCSWTLQATSGFAGYVHIGDQVNPETTAFGFRDPAGERIDAEEEEVLVAGGTAGAWSVEVDRHVGRAKDGGWAGVTGVVADVALP